jgi:hypothetical protein
MERAAPVQVALVGFGWMTGVGLRGVVYTVGYGMVCVCAAAVRWDAGAGSTYGGGTGVGGVGIGPEDALKRLPHPKGCIGAAQGGVSLAIAAA